MDAYANRVEAAANSAEGDTRVAEVEMGRAQDKVEVTQKKILARFSSSPSFSLGARFKKKIWYRVPQKKVGLVENRLWQILMLIVRNPEAILDKSI